MKTFKARYHNGIIEPLEDIQLPEDSELVVTVVEQPPLRPGPLEEGPFNALAGSWVGLVDCDQLIKDIYAAREIGSQRSVPRVEE